MSLKIVTVSDGFSSATVPSVIDPSASRTLHLILTAPNISSGFIILPVSATNPTSSTLEWQGVGQAYGADYDITGITINFLPGLLPKLTVGDFIVLTYT